MEVNLIIELILTAGIGIITFFLKRTIDELDSCKKDIIKIKEDYITKEDFFREQTENRNEAGYLHLRTVDNHVDTSLADSNFDDIEAKLTAKAIQLLAGVIEDECVEV